MTDYRATPEIWRWIESFADDPRDIATAILELRARVEALEANAKPTSNDRQIRSSAESEESLVERVGSALCEATGDQFNNWDEEARAAIREVAAWMREHGHGAYPHIWLVEMLEREAER